MYLNYYHLSREPFQSTPDPEFVFPSPSHREALASIMFGVEQRKGFIAIIGEVGVGKTTILRSYLEEINKQQLKIIYIFNTNVSFNGLLKTICQELELSAKTDDSVEMVNHLHQWLIGEYREGRNVVLIIDEAQNMPVDTMENLRMLSNLETSTDKLIQIVLAGQTELEQKLNLKELRQLNQRIAIKTYIMPLNKQESLAYIQHRLTKVGSKAENIYFPKALKLIVKQAKGIPRVINILCSNALITGYAYQQQQIPSKTIKEVIADLKGRRKFSLLRLGRSLLTPNLQHPSARKLPLLRWGLAPIAASLLFLLLFGFFWTSGYKDIPPSRTDSPIVTEDSKRQSVQLQEKPVISQVEKASLHEKGIDSTNRKEVSSTIPENVPARKTSEPSKPMTKVGSKTKQKPINPEEKTFPAKRIVQEGDTLFNLVSDVYSLGDRETIREQMKIVKENNPKIKDVDFILAGDEIVFPETKVPSAKPE